MPDDAPQLRLLFPPGSERLLTVDADPFTIGRRPGSHLLIAEKDISRIQAEIRREGGVWCLHDQGSAFGTSVNGRTVRRVVLRNRDLVAVGRERQFEMVFLHEDPVSRILDEVDRRPRTDTSPDVVRNLALLLEISRGLNALTSLHDILELALDATLDITQAERGFIMLRDENGTLVVRAARQLSRENLEGDSPRFSRTVVERVASTGEPLFLSDVTQEPGVKERSSVLDLALRTVLCVPLRLLPADRTTRPAVLARHGEVLGVIYADTSHARRPLPPLTRELVTSIAVQATLALENFFLRQEELERRLGDQEMEREMDRLRETDRVKSDLLSNVSHELKTPLTAIKGSLQNLLDGLAGEINEKQRRYLARACDNTDQLHRLIDDLLDLSMLETGGVTLRPRPTSVTRLLEDAAESLRPVAERRGVVLHVQPPPEDVVPVADRDRLMQVLFNLVGNSLKFTPQGGAITLEGRRERDDALLCVSDSGPGVPERELERIFDRFYQVPGPAGAKTGGTGLGLPIARSLVELHGGRIWAESSPAGSRFLFILPLAPPRVTPAPV
ncbi:MAG: ATP-binding protein [Candidatus Polarisedimenticolia bacterium]